VCMYVYFLVLNANISASQSPPPSVSVTCFQCATVDGETIKTRGCEEFELIS